MEADGTILIDTEINADGMKPGSKEVEAAARRMASSIDNIGKRAQKFVDDYVNGISEASKTNNEFKKEILTLSESLKQLEKKGLYFGDEEYDNAYLKLQKIQTALKDYRKELLSPTPNAKLFDSSSIEGEIEDLTNKLVKLREQGRGFGDDIFDSTFKSLSKVQEKLKVYKNNLTKKEEPLQLPIVIDTTTMEGQINLLKAKLQGLKNQQKGFGDAEYDSTALALKRAEQALVDYKNQLFKTDEQVAKEIEQQNKLNQKLEETKQKEAAAAAEAAKLSEIGKNAEISNPHVVRLKEEIQQLVLRQKELEKAGVGVGYKEYDQNAAQIKRLNEQLKKYTSVTNKANKSTKNINKSLKGSDKAANRTRMSLGKMLGMSILFSMTFRAMSVVANGIKEGLDNIVQYSDSANAAMSMLMSSVTYLKNTFATFAAPIVELIAPAMSRFISLLAEAVTWTAQLIAALTGKDTFVKAVKVQQDYAESLDKTGDKTEDVTKETKKMIAPFDTIIQMTTDAAKPTSNDKTELKPEDMFTTEIVNNDIKMQAEEIKKIFGSLFEPLKTSWNENGPIVLQSLNQMFASFKQLAGDVGASFMQIWNAEGYGKAITDDLLISLSNLFGIVTNLIDQFDKAWKSGDIGTSIMRNLGDIVLIVTGFFREASESIKNWAADIDFSPLLVSFNKVLSAIKPIASDVSSTLLWLLKNVLLPISKWGIEQALPAVFELIASALAIIHNVVEALKPLALWLWEEFLKPFGAWTGEIIIAALKKTTEWITKLSDWIRDHKVDVENITIAVLAFFSAWKVAEFVSNISRIISNLGGFLGIANTVISILSFTISKINLVNLAIAGIVSVIAILARNWKNMSPSEKIISSILAAASAVAILAVALHAVKGAVAAGLVAGAIAAGIIAATIAINAGKRSAQSSGGGARPFSINEPYSLSPYSAIPYSPPMLATGTVVPPRAGISYFGIGDNNHEPEIVSPQSTIEQAVENVLSRRGMNQEIVLKFSGNLSQLARLLKPEIENETKRIGVRMVTGV